ncbi:hypothetical protein HMF8227_00868 [Saliniradius amylolyticus]|uniref:Uncharacterized protein n=1 Tax=Saliniradius amylolyticus TaxID=2183582 RepID=A0A2S2E165_9ALTE|nr:hypothetical protein [Saliniradius amylolyticus]AWL11363.1 hypothetical protein HMF8227_00868 [Saliniradius amylolyticus]
MQEKQTSQDPFNFKYLLIALVVMLAMPTVHAILGWFVFYL